MLSNENKAGYFNVGFVAQYYQNIRERLQLLILPVQAFQLPI